MEISGTDIEIIYTIEKNFSDTVINHLDRLTDRTLDGLFDPTVEVDY